MRNLRCGQRRGQRHVAAGQGLAKTHDIGADAGMITGKQFTATAKPGGNLVGNQQHLILIAERTCLAQPFGGVKAHSTGALNNGFQNQCCQLTMVLGQQAFELCDIGGCKAAIKGGLRARSKQLLCQHATEQFMHAVDRIAHRHGTEGIAMVAVA